MVKQSDLVNPKSPEEYGSHANTDDEYEYSEEMLSEEEEPNDKDSCTEESYTEDSDEEPEEPLEEQIEEDASVEEIFEEEISEESEQELNGKEPMSSSMRNLIRDSKNLKRKSSDLSADAVADEDFCTEDSYEELEEAFEGDIEEDASVHEIIEEEISEEVDVPELFSPMNSEFQLPMVRDERPKAASADRTQREPSTLRLRDNLDLTRLDVQSLAREWKKSADRLNFLEEDNRFYRDKVAAMSAEIALLKDQSAMRDKKNLLMAQEIFSLKEPLVRKDGNASSSRETALVADQGTLSQLLAYQKDIARCHQLIHEANVATANLNNVLLKLSEKLIFAGKEKNTPGKE